MILGYSCQGPALGRVGVRCQSGYLGCHRLQFEVMVEICHEVGVAHAAQG